MTAPRARFRWTLRRSLAVAAISFGALAMAGDPLPRHTLRVDTQELAAIISSEVDHVTAGEVADWIVRGETDYRLIDIRSGAEYAKYHIPTAENVPLADLPDYGLGRNEKIVLYSDGGIHAAQAWMLLRVQKYPGVLTLFGGLEAWKDEVLFPVASRSPDPKQAAAFERTAQIARFFGGHPRAAMVADASSGTPVLAAAPAAPTMPQVNAPATPGKKPGAPAKKKKEGC